MAQLPMQDRVCLVTGASSGIGRETAVGLARLGATLLIHGRDPERSASALAEVRGASSGASVELITADLSSQSEVRRLAADVLGRHGRLDVLINNAGVIRTSRELTVDGLEYTFALNHLSYFLLTNLLLDQLTASEHARVVNVSSAAHRRARINFDDLMGEQRYRAGAAYGQSKLANILFTRELVRRLDGTGVTANSLHPGFVASNFGSGNRGLLGRAMRVAMRLLSPLAKSPERGAETSVYLASSPAVGGVTGRYFIDCREAEPTAAALSADVAERLWEVSTRLTAAN